MFYYRLALKLSFSILKTTNNHMKKHIYLTILLLSAISLGLLSCSEEDIFEKNGPQEINSIISQFSPEAFSKVVSSDYKVNWNVSAPLEHSEELGADYYEFEINLSESLAPITSKLYDIKQSLLAIKREGGKYDFYVAKYFMDRWKSGGKSVKDVSLSKIESFSGLLNVFDSDNQMIHAKRMDNGKVLGAPLSLNSDFSNGNIENRMVEDCEVVPTYHYVDAYHLSSDGQWWIYQYSDLVGISYDLECTTGYLPELDLSGGSPGNYYSQNGGGVYAGCEDPRHGCIYEIESNILNLPPDCASFNYVKTTTDAYWQEAAIKNFRFNIVVYDNNVLKSASFSFPEPILFGLPTQYGTGVTISQGEAAEISAGLLAQAIDNIGDRYARTSTSTAVIRSEFQKEVKKLYERISGRVNFNYQGSNSLITIKEYKTKLFGTGSCN